MLGEAVETGETKSGDEGVDKIFGVLAGEVGHEGVVESDVGEGRE